MVFETLEEFADEEVVDDDDDDDGIVLFVVFVDVEFDKSISSPKGCSDES